MIVRILAAGAIALGSLGPVTGAAIAASGHHTSLMRPSITAITTTAHHARFLSTTAVTRTPTTTAGRAMATAGPDRRPRPPPRSPRPSPSRAAGARGRRHSPGSYSWLRPARRPPGWQVGRLPSRTAALAYPRGWRPIRTDPGTFSAALKGPRRPRFAATSTRPRGRAPRRSPTGPASAPPQPRGGRSVGRARERRVRPALPLGDGLVRHRPLPDQQRRPLPRDRVHRARRSCDNGHRGGRAAGRLAAPRAAAAARGVELLLST